MNTSDTVLAVRVAASYETIVRWRDAGRSWTEIDMMMHPDDPENYARALRIGQIHGSIERQKRGR